MKRVDLELYLTPQNGTPIKIVEPWLLQSDIPADPQSLIEYFRDIIYKNISSNQDLQSELWIDIHNPATLLDLEVSHQLIPRQPPYTLYTFQVTLSSTSHTNRYMFEIYMDDVELNSYNYPNWMNHMISDVVERLANSHTELHVFLQTVWWENISKELICIWKDTIH